MPKTAIHHIAFEVRDWSDIKRACDMLAQQIKLAWGPLRHIIGHNIAIYHKNPDGVMIELFCDLDQMHDEELGFFEPRPWHQDRPQRPKVWGDGTLSNWWGPMSHNPGREPQISWQNAVYAKPGAAPGDGQAWRPLQRRGKVAATSPVARSAAANLEKPNAGSAWHAGYSALPVSSLCAFTADLSRGPFQKPRRLDGLVIRVRRLLRLWCLRLWRHWLNWHWLNWNWHRTWLRYRLRYTGHFNRKLNSASASALPHRRS